MLGSSQPRSPLRGFSLGAFLRTREISWPSDHVDSEGKKAARARHSDVPISSERGDDHAQRPPCALAARNSDATDGHPTRAWPRAALRLSTPEDAAVVSSIRARSLPGSAP